MVVANPTIRLILRDAINSVSRQATTYHCQVKPFQIVLKREALNERMTNTTIGV